MYNGSVLVGKVNEKTIIYNSKESQPNTLLTLVNCLTIYEIM